MTSPLILRRGSDMMGYAMISRTIIRTSKSQLALGLTLTAAVFLAGCIERNDEIYQASEEGGDYAVLDCSELEVAERSIGQRLTGAASYSSVGEPSTLLASQQNQLVTARSSRRCVGADTVGLVTPAEVVQSPNSDILLDGAQYLQVATFREAANRDRTVETLRSNGFQTLVRPIQLAGQTFYRVLVGPISSVSEVASVDALTIKMGFNDTFFVKG